MDVESLEKIVAERHTAVEDWIRRHAEKVCFPIYSSVDLRDAGFKMSAIDANIFPAGFNNLCDSFLENGAKLLRGFVTATYGAVQRSRPDPHQQRFRGRQARRACQHRPACDTSSGDGVVCALEMGALPDL
ncbi:MAG: glutamate--cysteine ligase [Candidatus Lindowbacteria bacterium]|nr:glutamate--cysteine ligase [Candidatus Lindowbacteria bacterium]